MLKRIVLSFRGAIALFSYSFNLCFFGMILFIFAFIRILFPWDAWRTYFYKHMNRFPTYWADVNCFIMKKISRVKLATDDLHELNPKGWYLVLPNHQSWADIIILGNAFNRKIPLLKFFIKKELLWIPVLGLICRTLHFPVMGRYSKDYLKKHPEMKGKDVETTRKACEKFKTIPTSIINFCEGTRFTKKKHLNQHSPFKFLLKPKAGGIAFVLATMGDYLHQLLDVTIVYPSDKASAWQFLCGTMKCITVKTRLLPIQPELLGNYENDLKFRQTFQKWLNELWYEKDNLILRMKQTTPVCKHYLISGKVQGVWYRAFAEKQAKKRKITGWIRNLPDGRVEIVACGCERILAEFKTYLYAGPPLARVENIEEEIISEPQIFDTFDLR